MKLEDDLVLHKVKGYFKGYVVTDVQFRKQLTTYMCGICFKNLD